MPNCSVFYFFSVIISTTSYMLKSANFSKGHNCPPPRRPSLAPCVIRKYFLHILIYICISSKQSHSYAFEQVSSAMLMFVDLVPSAMLMFVDIVLNKYSLEYKLVTNTVLHQLSICCSKYCYTYCHLLTMWSLHNINYSEYNYVHYKYVH